MTTITEARDAIISTFRTAWLASGTTASLTLLYDDKDGSKPGLNSAGVAQSYARITVRHQAGSAETVGGPGIGKDVQEGLVVVQCFTPKGDGYAAADAIAEVVKRAFQRKRITGIDGWFFDVTPTEVPNEGPWNQINVSAGFRWSDPA